MKDDCIYLLYIRDAIEHIMENTTAGKVSFLPDRKTQDALVRNLEVIGESNMRLSPLLKNAHPTSPGNPSLA